MWSVYIIAKYLQEISFEIIYIFLQQIGKLSCKI